MSDAADRDLTDRLLGLIPRDSLRQMVAVLEEYRRRAERGHDTPREVEITLHLDGRGRVVEATIPRRFGLIETE